MNTFKFYSPKCAFFGYGCLSEVGDEILSNGYKKALIVTDKSLIKLGMIEKVTKMLEKAKIEFSVFDGVKPNPTVANVNAGLDQLKKENCDFCISVGGGSAHDCAKAICILATNGGEIMDYIGVNKSKVCPLPLVAVNTTAGTASEFTQAFVIVDEKTSTKVGSRDKNVVAAIAVDDHELMMGLPKGLTAGTGMDALTHAIEAYTSKRGFEMTSAIGMAAIREVFRFLPGAVLNPNETNRGGMAVAQYLAGMAFGNSSCGMVHSMSHQLSAIYDLPHGVSNAILLPTVVEFNCKDEVAKAKYAELAEAIFPYECENKKIDDKAKIFINEIRKLSIKIGIPADLTSMGVKKEDVDLLAQKAMKDGSLAGNPIMPTEEQVKELYLKLL